jgi:hypothetical protein
MSARTMQVSAAKAKLDEGAHTLSSWSFPGLDAPGVARAAKEVDPTTLPHSVIRASTAGRIRAAGYELVATDPQPGHYSLMLPDPPTDDDWAALNSIFGEPQPNPVARGT